MTRLEDGALAHPGLQSGQIETVLSGRCSCYSAPAAHASSLLEYFIVPLRVAPRQGRVDGRLRVVESSKRVMLQLDVEGFPRTTGLLEERTFEDTVALFGGRVGIVELEGVVVHLINKTYLAVLPHRCYQSWCEMATRKVRQRLRTQVSQTPQLASTTRQGFVAQLNTNVFQQNKVDYYMGLDAESLNTLLSITFTPNELTHELGVFVVRLLKKNSFIVSICLNHPHFSIESFFRFLTEQTYTLEQLTAFEDIMLPFCKKHPQKLLQIMIKHDSIRQSLLGQVYLKQVFKVVYTAVFCLEKEHFKQEEKMNETVEAVIAVLVGSVLKWAPDCDQSDKMLNCADVADNFQEFIVDLMSNLRSVELNLAQKLVNQLGSAFLSKLITKLHQLMTHSNQEEQQYCEGLIMIELNLLRLLENFKFTLQKKYDEHENRIRQRVEEALTNIAKHIGTQFATFCRVLTDTPNRKIVSPSGQRVPVLGMARYHLLQIIEKVLSLNEIEDMALPWSDFDLLSVIEELVRRHRWNSVAQILLVKIGRLVMSSGGYTGFLVRHVMDRTPGRGLFGNIIACYRNRKYYAYDKSGQRVGLDPAQQDPHHCHAGAQRLLPPPRQVQTLEGLHAARHQGLRGPGLLKQQALQPGALRRQGQGQAQSQGPDVLDSQRLIRQGAEAAGDDRGDAGARAGGGQVEPQAVQPSRQGALHREQGHPAPGLAGGLRLTSWQASDSVCVYNIECAMFELKQKENTQLSALFKRANTLKAAHSRSQKQSRLSALRHAHYCEVLNWRIPQEHFLSQLDDFKNEFSILVTLMDISDDPQWRNYLPHLCGVMRKLHNLCLDTRGHFLSEIGMIPNYHERLIKVLYLNDPTVQRHFKQLISLLLVYNAKYQTLSEADISQGLIDCARGHKEEEVVDYLWILTQIQCRQKTVAKALSIAQECIGSASFIAKGLVVLPVLTICSNYVVYESNMPVLQELAQSQSLFQTLGWSLGQQNMDIRRQALLLCNNLLAKSSATAACIVPLASRIDWTWGLECQEQIIFEQLASRRTNNYN